MRVPQHFRIIWNNLRRTTSWPKRVRRTKLSIFEWKGNGWIEMGAQRFNLESSEVFAEKASGLAIVVEGLHLAQCSEGDQIRNEQCYCGSELHDLCGQ